jgi:Flp pilus assembly protein TadD
VSSSADLWPLAAVFLAALIVRLIVATELWNLPIVRTPKLDSAEFLSWARRLAAGDFAWPVVSPHGPGYPFFLAALLAIGTGSLKFAIATQAVVGSLTAVMIAAIGRGWFGARAGWVAGLAYALYGPAVYIDTAILSEGLLVFLLTVALWVIGGASARLKPRASDTAMSGAAAIIGARGFSRAAFIAGATLGLATLVRPTAIVVALAFVVWLVTRGSRRNAAILAAAFAIVVAPAIAKNYSVSRSVSIQGYGGLNVYIGDSPLHSGRPTFRLGAGWDALNAEAARAGISDPALQDRYYVTKTIGEIRRYLGSFLKLIGAKLLWLVQSEEIRDSHSFYFFAERSPILRVLPRWAILFPLACIGAIVIARLKPRAPSAPRAPSTGRAPASDASLWSARLEPSASLLLAYTVAAIVTTVFLVIGTRYRMPIVPAMALAAGAGLDALIDAAAERRARELVVDVCVVVAALIVSHAMSDPKNLNVAEEWAFTGSSLITERDLAGAERAFRQAIVLDPQSGLAWDGLGLAQYDDGRFADARRSLARALALDPENARALFHLGLVDEQEKKMADAASDYRRAADLSPYDAEIMLRLATALGTTGRSSEARDAMRRVVEWDPMNGDAWLDLCLLSLDAHDVGGASEALQRADVLGANPQKLAFASQALDRARR